MAAPPHHSRVEQPLRPITAIDAASALGWLATAGVDTLVTDTPRNWLSAPVAAPLPTNPAAVSRSAPMPAPIGSNANQAATLAGAAVDLADLDAGLAAFAHPLRRTDTPPQLLTGAIAAGIIVLGDQPEPPGTPVARLADRMLAAIGLSPASCARSHLLPWATPAARPPRDDEIAAFAAFRVRAFELAAPRLILAFGDRAAALSGEQRGIASSRGKWFEIAGVPMLATFHPRVLLTQPELKRLAWADLQAFATRISA